MDGFIQLHKKICEWEWYTDIPTKTLFLHILLKCNYKEAKWRGIDVKPGDFITSLDHLAQETGLTVRQVRTALEHLEKTGEATRQSTSQYTILTLNNWASYNTRDDKQTTNEGQTNDKRPTTTNKEYKEYKENNISKDTEQAPKYAISEIEQDEESKEIHKHLLERTVEIAKETYGKEEINMMQSFLRKAVGVSQFKDSKERWYVQHCYSLLKKIGREDFNTRLQEILSDPFKAKNCNKLAYLYGELKSYIHTPVVEPQRRGLEV